MEGQSEESFSKERTLISVVEFNDVNLLEDNFIAKRIHLGMKKENVLVPSLIPIELDSISLIEFSFRAGEKEMQTFIFVAKETFIPDGEEARLSTMIREYEFSDDVDLSCWIEPKFWISYDEKSNCMELSDSYEDFFEWLSELPEGSYSQQM